jgi:hypothetical protein
MFVALQKGHISETADVNSESENEKKSNLGFIHAFIASISVIIVSELGDKTFFIAAIMAMRHPRLTIFLGAITALGLMTILSGKFHTTLLGMFIKNIIYRMIEKSCNPY